MPWIVNGLGEVAFAILSLVWTMMTYFTMWDFGVGRAVTKFVAEKRGSGKSGDVVSIVLISVVISVLLGILFGGLIWGFDSQLSHLLFKVSPKYEPTVVTALRIVAIAMPILMLQSVLRGVIMGFERFDYVNSIQVFNGIFQWGGALVLVLLHFNVLWVIALVMGMRFVTTVVLLWMISRVMRWQLPGKNLDISLLKEILVFGGWAMVSQVVSPILVNTERFMLSALVATSVVTFYVVPYEATSRMTFLSIALVTALFPAMSEIHEVNGLDQSFRKLYLQSERILVFTFLPIGALFLMFTPEILKVWMGAPFSLKASYPFEILSIAFMINSVSQLPFTMLQAVGRPDLTGKTHLIELPIHLLVAYMLIQTFGLIGAALATLIRLIFDASLLYFFASTRLRLQIGFIRDIKKIIVPTLCLLVGVIGVAAFPQEIVTKVIIGFVSLLVYAVLVFKFSLEENERQLISKLVLRITNT